MPNGRFFSSKLSDSWACQQNFGWHSDSVAFGSPANLFSQSKVLAALQ